MTTDQSTSSHNLEKMNANIEKIEELSSRLIAAFGSKRQVPTSLQGPSPELYSKAATRYFAEIAANPSRLLEQQVGYWGQTLKHFVEAQEELSKGQFNVPKDDFVSDRRFANDVWNDHPYFNFVKQQYLINTNAIETAVNSIEGLDPNDQKRLKYFSGQIMDMLSPTNFLGTNPDALQRAVETEGQSLVDGLENLVHDLEANDGELLVTLADRDAFTVGENIATTKGSVVFRNRMFELIQFAPTTEQVHETPLVIFPPWINKFYVMDLKEKNSLIKWIVDSGFTLFVVSWVNPDADYADVGMDTYIQEGYLTAFDQVKEITGQDQINVAGYCIAGTTLSLVLSLLARRGDRSINSATFFTALTDFSDQGEFGVFLDDDFIDGIEAEADEHGYLDKFYMARTFSFLRANDLIYGPAVKSYMMGEAPPAFDLLYWNGDGTNLPARMAVEYLRWLCQENRFADGGVELMGERLHLKDVTVPVISIACETDHIAAAKDVYRGVQQMGSRDKTYILSESGHIAGIINPPSKKKYGHYHNLDLDPTFDDWKDAATLDAGSWWPRWGKWLANKSGAKVAARAPGGENHPILGPAPGTYVVGAKFPKT